METFNDLPTQCPSCGGALVISRMTCFTCGTEVAGAFSLNHLASLREPHASLIELFLRVRGNMKDMERILGISYPTVRARLEEALQAAGLDREEPPIPEAKLTERRVEILRALQEQTITPAQAATRLRDLASGKST